jgi:tetratricopeptide (TPR) repeat protein
MTDHYIQRVKPERDLLAPKAEVADEPTSRSGIAMYYPTDRAHTAHDELYIAVAEVKHGTGPGIAHLQSVIAKYSPTEPEFYLELGDAYAKSGKEEEAIHWYSEALRRKPNFRPAVKQLAAALIVSGQLTRAIDILQQTIAVPPADDALLSDLGNAYLRQRLFEKAQQSLMRALAINPEQPEAEIFLV